MKKMMFQLKKSQVKQFKQWKNYSRKYSILLVIPLMFNCFGDDEDEDENYDDNATGQEEVAQVIVQSENTYYIKNI